MSDDDEVVMNVDDGEITTNVDDDETSMDVDEPLDQCPAFVTFNCSTPGCVKQYRLYNNLVKHHARGDHLFKPDKVTLRDRAILMYKDRAESIKPNPIHQLNNFTVVNSTSLLSDDDSENDEHQKQDNEDHNHEQQRWALSEPKATIHYPPEQIKYLTEKYNEGETNGYKWNPSSSTRLCPISTKIYCDRRHYRRSEN